MADVPFLGCKISLISKCDIRYEGILYCVDPKESTISLSKVRSYGTETRGDPANFVPPKNDVYDVIIFRASDVKDLRVDAPEPPGLSDPAIISARQSSNSTFDANPNGSRPTSSGPSQQKPLLPVLPIGKDRQQRQQHQQQQHQQPQRQPQQQRQSQQPQRQQEQRHPQQQREQRQPRQAPQHQQQQQPQQQQHHVGRRPPQRMDYGNRPMNTRRGGMHGGRPAPRGPPRGPPRGMRKSAPLKFEGEYDFDEANKIFAKLDSKFKNLKVKDDEKEENGESSGDRANSKSPNGKAESGSGYDSDEQNHKDGDSKEGFGGSVSGEYYDKSKSFFDNISCEANERGQGKLGKPDWRKERQTNAETFGISANYRRGGYRGRSYGANGYHRR